MGTTSEVYWIDIQKIVSNLSRNRTTSEEDKEEPEIKEVDNRIGSEERIWIPNGSLRILEEALKDIPITVSRGTAEKDTAVSDSISSLVTSRTVRKAISMDNDEPIISIRTVSVAGNTILSGTSLRTSKALVSDVM